MVEASSARRARGGSTWIPVAVVLLGFAGCGAPAPEGEEPPAPPEEPERDEPVEAAEEEEAVEPEEPEGLQHVAVTAPDPVAPFRQGDSLAVTFEQEHPLGHTGRVYDPTDGFGDAISASEVGPLPGSTGWVTATTVNVRACPDAGCEAVGSLRQGHETEVHALEDGWYALDEAGSRWVSAEHIAGAEGWSAVLAGMVAEQFESFYGEYLAGRRPEVSGEEDEPLFSRWHMGVDGGRILQVILSANHNQGPAGHEVCQWAHSSAEVLEDLAAQIRGYGVQDHYVEVRYRGRADEPVARLAEDGEITCILR